MARQKAATTKNEIIQIAMQLFLEKGYSNTTVKSISDALEISTGNLTFHYPTKEHLLARLTEMLCSFQWKMFHLVVDEEDSSLLAIGMELAAMASSCEVSEVAKDFYLSSYTHEMSLDLIRKSDSQRAKIVYGEFCADWSDAQYQGAEILVSGIEYATFIQTDDTPLEERIANAFNAIMMIHQVPEEIRKHNLERVLAMDYRKLGRRILTEFKEYIKVEE